MSKRIYCDAIRVAREPRKYNRKQVASYEVRLSTGQVIIFEEWLKLTKYIRLPEEKSIELFTMAMGSRGEWVGFK